MRVLITGGAGFVGRQLAVELQREDHETAVTVHHHDAKISGIPELRLDITDLEKTLSAINGFNPDVTIHAAALTDADHCEQSPRLANTVNVGGTENVVTACENINSSLVFISSSFVFSGDCSVYDETASRSPINVYGETKMTAEDIVIDSSIPSLIIRTDQPYGWPKPWQPPSMVSWLLDKLSDDGPVSVFDDWWNNPIYNPDLAKAIRKLIENGSKGEFHVAGPDFISRYQWACKIADIFGEKSERIFRASSMNADLPANRPNVHLSSKKMRKETGFIPRDVSEGLSEMVYTSNREFK